LVVFFDIKGTIRAEFVPRGTIDNAPCHTSLAILQYLADIKFTVCPHPPYSTDLAPCDFWLFPKIQLTMKGNRFDTIPEIEAATTERLRALRKDDFKSRFRIW
jgi:hypothetical protein